MQLQMVIIKWQKSIGHMNLYLEKGPTQKEEQTLKEGVGIWGETGNEYILRDLFLMSPAEEVLQGLFLDHISEDLDWSP